MADIFVSYKKTDKQLVDGFVRDLQDEGFTVWWDYEIETGEAWLERLVREIDVARCVVGVWTRNAIDERGLFRASADRGTNYLQMEHQRGAAKLAPAMFDTDALPIQFPGLQAADLRGYVPGRIEHDGFRKLITQIERLAMPQWAASRIASLEAQLTQQRAARQAAEQQVAALRTIVEVKSVDNAARIEPIARDDARSLLQAVISAHSQAAIDGKSLSLTRIAAQANFPIDGVLSRPEFLVHTSQVPIIGQFSSIKNYRVRAALGRMSDQHKVLVPSDKGSLFMVFFSGTESPSDTPCQDVPMSLFSALEPLGFYLTEAHIRGRITTAAIDLDGLPGDNVACARVTFEAAMAAVLDAQKKGLLG